MSSRLARADHHLFSIYKAPYRVIFISELETEKYVRIEASHQLSKCEKPSIY